MYKEADSVNKLKGIGDKSADIFRKAGVENIGDLLMYLPLRYETYDEPVHISDEYVGRVISVKE